MSARELRICLFTGQEFLADPSSRVRFASREACEGFREAAYRDALARVIEAAAGPRVGHDLPTLEGTGAGTQPRKHFECAPDFRGTL